MIASGSGDGTIKLWNKTSGHLLRTLTSGVVFYGGVDFVTFDANDMLASCSSCGRTVKLWNKYTGDLLRTLTFDDDVAFDTNAMISRDYDHETNEGDYCIVSCAFDANVMIASVGNYLEITIKLWNKNTGDLLRTLTGHGDRVTSFAFDANDMLASGSWDGTIKLWNKNTGDLLRTQSHGFYVLSVAFDAVLHPGSQRYEVAQSDNRADSRATRQGS